MDTENLVFSPAWTWKFCDLGQVQPSPRVSAFSLDRIILIANICRAFTICQVLCYALCIFPFVYFSAIITSIKMTLIYGEIYKTKFVIFKHTIQWHKYIHSSM